MFQINYGVFFNKVFLVKISEKKHWDFKAKDPEISSLGFEFDYKLL